MSKQKNNSGSLFANDRKEKETHPDLTGSIVVDGVEYWISAWKKTSQGGKKYLSVSVNPKNEKPAKSSRQERDEEEESDDELF